MIGQRDRQRLGNDEYTKRQRKYGKNKGIPKPEKPSLENKKLHLSQCPLCQDHAIWLYRKESTWGCFECAASKATARHHSKESRPPSSAAYAIANQPASCWWLGG